MSIDPPYRMDMFQTIINVHFGGLYLIVELSGGNSIFNQFASPGGVGAPQLDARIRDSKVRLLDVAPLGGAGGNRSSSGFLNCFVYPEGEPLQGAWEAFQGVDNGLNGPFGEFVATNNACPWPGGGEVPPGLTVSPIEFQSFATRARAWLYAIPEADNLVQIEVDGLLPPDSTTYTSQSGGGGISVSVYSTVRKAVKRVADLIDISGDGKPRPTEDDKCTLNLTSDTQGKFLISVHQDKDKDDAQVDNYGKTFQPYKVTLDHGGATDNIPSQPPPRLPNA